MHIPNISLLSLSFILSAAIPTLAQTSTSCDPTKKSCPADTALSKSIYTHDFTKGADDDNWKVTAGDISYTNKGAEFTIKKAGDAPTIQSQWYIFFGSVSFIMTAAPGKGVVSSAILESDDLDEVDWEWLGGEPGNVQTNYFGKGNTTTHDREVDAAITDTQGTTHNYTIHWTSSATSWLVDDIVVRTLPFRDANGGSNYPQTPMNVRIGIWAGGDPTNAEGTIEWAGGETDYSKAPFTMVLEKVEVRNDNPGSSYSYGDMTGGFKSIVVDGKGGSAKKSDGEDETKASSASASASASASGSGSASPSATVNVDGGVGGEWASAISNSTGASSTASMVTSAGATGSATGSAAVAENTSGAMASKSLGGSLIALVGALAVML